MLLISGQGEFETGLLIAWRHPIIEIKVIYDNNIILNLPYMFDSQVLGVLGLQRKDVI